MIGSYLKSAYRNLLLNRLYTVISVIGLAIGLAAFMLLGLFVREEARYDHYHENADQLYRVTRDILTSGGTLDRRLATNSPQVAPLLLEDFPEIKKAARFRLLGGRQIKTNEVTYHDEMIGFADNSLPEMFSFNWIQGDSLTALSRPDSVVLTESAAQKYFASLSVIGETLLLEDKVLLTVTGVISDLPNHSHMRSPMFVSMPAVEALYPPGSMQDWSNGNFSTYILLHDDASINSVTDGFDAFLQRHLGEDAVRARMHAMNVQDIHLHWAGRDMKRTSSVSANLYYFLVGLSILLIACCNYTNLSLAASMRRIREVGIRKTMGASRRQLILQHVGESLLIVSVATVIALVLVELLLPVFNAFIRETLVFNPLGEPDLVLTLMLIVVLVSFFSSIYPALYLSKQQPREVLLASHKSRGTRFFSKGLVVLQFSMAIVFVVIALVMTLQMNFLRDREMGFDMDGLIRLDNNFTDNLGNLWPDFKRTLQQYPGIAAITGSDEAPFHRIVSGNNRVRIEGEDQGSLFPHAWVDESFFTAYEIPVLAGRTFSSDGRDKISNASQNSAGWSANYILNETAARKFGWSAQQAIGQRLESGLEDIYVSGVVVGVVSDTRFAPDSDEARAVLYRQPDESDYEGRIRNIAVRLNPANQAETLSYIENAWNQFMPDRPLAWSYFVDDFEEIYIIEIKLGQLFTMISIVTVIIACLGLFGLAAFNTESRIKEIGVRKVLGSTVWDIVVMLSSQFSRLVLAANFLAWPVAWYAMHLWLQQYPERITLTPFVFIGSGAIALSIAWVTVGGTAAKAASQKPVLALRYE